MQRLQPEQIASCLASGSDGELWDDAKNAFMVKHRPKKESSAEAEQFTSFIAKSENVTDMRRLCGEIQESADAKYMTSDLKIKGKTIVPGTWLKQTISAMDGFIMLGDVAFKGGSETLSLGWTAVKWVLQAVKADSDRCSQWAESSEMISRILLTCKTIGKMYSTTTAAPTELVGQLLKQIPEIYESILTFSWAARKQVDRSGFRRGFSAVNPFSSSGEASKDAFEKIKTYYQQIKDDGQAAFQEFSNQALRSLGEGQREVIGFIRKQWDENQRQMRALSDTLSGLSDDIVQKLDKKLRRPTPFEADTQRFEEYVKRLEPLDHHVRIKSLKIQNRQPGTCTWIFENKDYLEWLSSDRSRLLLVAGDSGLGKSVLTSTVIEDLESMSDGPNAPILAYFYCLNTGNTAGSQKASRLIQDVIYRIYKQAARDEDLLAEANRLFVKSKDGKGKPAGTGTSKDSHATSASAKSANSLLGDPDEVLVKLIKLLKRKVIVVIDALDECIDKVEEELYKSIHSWLDVDDIQIKVFVSSRPETDTMREFDRYTTLGLEKYNQEDLSRRVDAALGDYVNLSPTERRRVRAAILSRAENQFTYVNLAMSVLQQPWQRPIDNVISRLQDGVTRLYQETLRGTDPNYTHLAKAILTWTLLKQDDLSVADFFDIYSKRFTATEVVHEADVDSLTESEETVEEGHASAPNYSPNYSLWNKQVKKAAGTFVRVTTKELLQEVHQNVRECFLAKETRSSNAEGYFSISEASGHLEITLELLTILNSTTFCDLYMKTSGTSWKFKQDQEPEAQRKPSPWNIWNELEACPSAVRATQELPLRNGTNGTEKEQIATTDAPAEVHDTDDEALTQKDTDSSPKDDSAAAGSQEIQDSENDKGSDSKPMDKASGEAPAMADDDYDGQDSDDPDLDADLDILEDSGASNEPDVTPSYPVCNWFRHLKEAEKASSPEQIVENPLWELVWTELRRFLLDKAKFQSWISTAASMGVYDGAFIMTGLADRVITPFHLMASLGMTWVIDRMAREGADLCVFDEGFALPIHYAGYDATLSDDLPLLRILMQHNNIALTSDHDQAPAFLSLLTFDPDEDVVRTMLENISFDLDELKDSSQNSAMHYVASCSSRKSVAQLILDRGADINALSSDGSNPLHYLLYKSNIDAELLDFFLDHGANVNQESNTSKRPLYEAALNGELSAVSMLLRGGPQRQVADVNDEDDNGLVAMHAAAINGHIDVVKCLLAHDADIMYTAKSGSTPFYSACKCEESDVALHLLRLLQSKQVPVGDIDRPRYNLKTPLWGASYSGLLEVVQSMLEIPGMLERINAKDARRGRTCLHVAALKGKELVVKLLLQQGAKTSTDKKGKTALQLCCERWSMGSKTNYEATTLLLIEADPESAKADPAALFTAAQVGNLKMLHRLLEAGANPNVTDDHGWKPIQVARHNGHKEVVQVLEHGGISGFPPTRLVPPKNQAFVTCGEEENTYYHNEEPATRVTLVADHPIRLSDPNGYFEIEILKEPAESGDETWLSIGLATYPWKQLGWLPGWAQPSVQTYGWHGDDGWVFSGRTSMVPEFVWPKYGRGQVVGCGYNADDKSVYFTLDGQLQGSPFKDVGGRLFPVFGLCHHSGIKANFQGPFVYKQEEVTGLDDVSKPGEEQAGDESGK